MQKSARIYSYTTTTNENWINKQAKKWGTSKAAVVDAILTEARKNKMDITLPKKKVTKKVAKKATKKVVRKATNEVTKKATTSILG